MARDLPRCSASKDTTQSVDERLRRFEPPKSVWMGASSWPTRPSAVTLMRPCRNFRRGEFAAAQVALVDFRFPKYRATALQPCSGWAMPSTPRAGTTKDALASFRALMANADDHMRT